MTEATRTLPMEVGDVIMTQEILPVKLGTLNKRRLQYATLYKVTSEFQVILMTMLENVPETMTLFELFGEQYDNIVIQDEGKSYGLNDIIYTSSSYSMPWVVVSANKEKGRFSLMAIAQNREARTRDWFGYHRLVSGAMPPLNEYLTVEEVDMSFFEKKAVYKFGENGMERIG